MAYRKTEVNGKTYEYTVGRKFLKIKGIGTVDKETIGTKIEQRCECCDEPNGKFTTGVITPKIVQQYIEKNI